MLGTPGAGSARVHKRARQVIGRLGDRRVIAVDVVVVVLADDGGAAVVVGASVVVVGGGATVHGPIFRAVLVASLTTADSGWSPPGHSKKARRRSVS